MEWYSRRRRVQCDLRRRGALEGEGGCRACMVVEACSTQAVAKRCMYVTSQQISQVTEEAGSFSTHTPRHANPVFFSSLLTRRNTCAIFSALCVHNSLFSVVQCKPHRD